MMGVHNRLADGITRWNGEEIQKNLTKESSQTVWRAQELGKEEQLMMSKIAQEEGTPLDGSRYRLAYEENWWMGELEDVRRKRNLVGPGDGGGRDGRRASAVNAVSYTHLTLPTIYSV